MVSPIRNCPKCNSEFLDKRQTEVAIDGCGRGKENAKTYVLVSLIFLIITIASVFRLINKINNGDFFPVKIIGCIIVGIAGTIMSLILFFKIVTGYEDEQNAKYMEEPKKRLQNKEYVEKLIAYGYQIYDKNLK